MAEYPALPLFTDAYIADTRHLTAAQHGGYLLLLMTAWRMPDCKLPDDDVFLCRCAGFDKRTWLVHKPVIMSFWEKDADGRWFQKRLLDERKHVDDVRNKNALAGNASALKRKGRHSTSVSTKTQPNSNPHTHTHTHTQNITPTSLDKATPEGGVFINENLGGKGVDYVIGQLNESQLAKAKANAPGWDIYYLAEIYLQGLAERGMPNNMASAFIGWCKKYTKGNEP